MNYYKIIFITYFQKKKFYYYLKKIIIKIKNKFSLLYMPTILQPFYQKKKKKQFFNPNSNPDSKPNPNPNPNPHSQLFVYSLIISYWI